MTPLVIDQFFIKHFFGVLVSTKLFVGSLPWSVNDDKLKSAFEAHGNVVSAKVVMDKTTGRSRGFGFVEMGQQGVMDLGQSGLGIHGLIAFMGGYVLEQWFDHFHHHDQDSSLNAHDVHEFVPLIVIGDTVHNFIDGIAIAAAYLVSPGLGVTVAISTLLHEVPHEIGDFGIMLHAGYTRMRVLAINFLSSLTTFIGVFVMLFLGEKVENALGVILAIAAGMFLYIASTDLLPRVTKASTGRARKTIVLLVGIAVMVIITRLIPHSG